MMIPNVYALAKLEGIFMMIPNVYMYTMYTFGIHVRINVYMYVTCTYKCIHVRNSFTFIWSSSHKYIG